MSNQLPVDYVIGGACYTKASSFTRCALQPSDCTRDGNDFVAPFRLAVTAPLVSATCNRQESVRGVSLGRCEDETQWFLCTSDASACSSQSVFAAHAADCTVHGDYGDRNDLEGPIFGMCLHEKNPARDWCAWQKSECGLEGTSEYGFLRAQVDQVHMHPTRCACKDVHVGGCVAGEDREASYFCAVAAEVCAAERAGYTYKPALKFQRQMGKSCRLCDASWSGTVLAPTAATAEPSAVVRVTPFPVQRPLLVYPSPTAADLIPSPVSTEAPPVSSEAPPVPLASNGGAPGSGEELSGGAAAGIVLGVTGTVVVAAMLLYLMSGRGRQRHDEQGEDNGLHLYPSDSESVTPPSGMVGSGGEFEPRGESALS